MKDINRKIFEVSDFSDTLILDNLVLTLVKNNNKIKQGRNHLFDVRWVTYSFDKVVDGYKAVNLMFFKIDEKTLEEAKTNIIYDNNKTTAKTPNVDGDSGNIHPSHRLINESSKDAEKICQLVLCKNDTDDPGPNTIDMDINEDLYDNKLEKTKVHKSCYFPRIDNVKSNDSRYILLKRIAEKLNPEYLSTELYNEIYD